jgi:hypothetical protein
MNLFYISVSKKELQKIHPNIIHNFSLVHNLALQMFSLYIFICLATVFVQNRVIAKQQYYFQMQGVDSLLFWFYLSKYYEFIDTFILYAKMRNPIFLQKFHHMGATFIWHLGYVYKLDAIYFASLLNSGVHSIMYLYYFTSMYPIIIDKIRKYKIYITSIQIAQLAYGAFAIPWYYYDIENNINKGIIIIFDVYIAVLLVLFFEFIYSQTIWFHLTTFTKSGAKHLVPPF